ncbi:vacuole morphology and inheritance protein [Durotheca rogersii]|uniref:vacuole morphology and inheritance protein n=1 Tax=Durotheca rogersii TaxID=419775 RepID=UPI00221F0C4B|nr:vacuole morphology and inheritance protein [Durotheca rogersii]KAI5854095.1 vacuole morphology and inheritance protein [Durotheca rogersii]
MEPTVQRLLTDKLYDKRKAGALELERSIRELVVAKDYTRIENIINQLCNEYAYAIHQPHARNGGLIGLAAAAIALGSELPAHLETIVSPVVACFTDQDARVRYYACESMYNIAKVAKGEILSYFNYIFDALCKLGADSELSVKNGAELLDRLIKDIVTESAATYVSVLQSPADEPKDSELQGSSSNAKLPTAFSLPKFIPLLKERIWIMNPFTRTFLVGWIILLDSIPDLELVTYLPEFLAGLLKFLNRNNADVHAATQTCLDKFLNEIKRIARVRKGIADSRKSKGDGKRKREESVDSSSVQLAPDEIDDAESITANEDEDEAGSEDDWVPGQDVAINYKEILEILTATLDSPLGRFSLLEDTIAKSQHHIEEDSVLESLRWIVSFLDICPEEVLPFTPKILAHLLPAMASGVEPIRQAAARVNTSLMEYVVSLTDESEAPPPLPTQPPRPLAQSGVDRPEGASSTRASLSSGRDIDIRSPTPAQNRRAPTPAAPVPPQPDLDYAAAVNSLTLLFLNDHEATRVAALTWLIMLHRKAPRKIVAFNDGTFPALLKTLSDPAEAVVTKDLQLLSQISRNSEDDYFSNFMVSLLQLFSTDRKLLETRGNLIIRQLCMTLSPERIYRTLAETIEKEEDLEFASIMVQNLNNNLITAPELADLRKRLRNLETKDGQLFFVALFRSWCYNAVATFSLCLLAQAYEAAYNLLQIFAELEMTVNILIQIDKLVQLIESPVFTYLRLQLLEPEKYPYLYKCLYGLLMLLPQSSAFAALKNRLNSVSSIGYLQFGPRPYVSSTTATPTHSWQSSTAEAISSVQSPVSRPRNAQDTYSSLISTVVTPSASNYDRPSRLGKGREENNIRWDQLLEKFRSVQDKARRVQRLVDGSLEDGSDFGELRVAEKETSRPGSGPAVPPKDSTIAAPAPKRSGLGRQFGRLGATVSGRGKRSQ